MKKKCYAAGIINAKDDWNWQGTVVATSINEAKKMLSKFKKEKGFDGRCEVVSFFPCETKRGARVYNSTIIH